VKNFQRGDRIRSTNNMRVFKGVWRFTPMLVAEYKMVNMKDDLETSKAVSELRSFVHPNVSIVFASGIQNGWITLILEYLPNTLEDVFTKNIIPLNDVICLDIITQIAKGLNYIHTLPGSYVHGAVCSETILMDIKGIIKLEACLFPINRLRQIPAIYKAPEVVNDGNNYTQAADVFFPLQSLQLNSYYLEKLKTRVSQMLLHCTIIFAINCLWM